MTKTRYVIRTSGDPARPAEEQRYLGAKVCPEARYSGSASFSASGAIDEAMVVEEGEVQRWLEVARSMIEPSDVWAIRVSLEVRVLDGSPAFVFGAVFGTPTGDGR